MTTIIHVQFSDASETAVISVFGGNQSPNVYSNLGKVELDDPRYLAFYDLLPADVQSGLPAPVNLAHEK